MTSDITDIQNKIKELEKELRNLKQLAKDAKLQKAKEHEELEGIEGEFDGVKMVTASGEKYAVPANYAAKSKLVCGDRLKLFEKDGKPFFKQLTKVDRVSVDGVISKKEGEWYFISDSGSHRILPNAAEFHSVALNDEAIATLPKNNLHAPYAALEKVLKPQSPKQQQPEPVIPKAAVREEPKKVEKVEKPEKEEVSSLRVLSDDDLR